jgi:hypothetical protein
MCGLANYLQVLLYKRFAVIADRAPSRCRGLIMPLDVP